MRRSFLTQILKSTWIRRIFQKKQHLFLETKNLVPNLEGIDSSEYRKIKIRHHGPTESLNVSVAASIACYEFSRRSLQAEQNNGNLIR